MGGGGGGTSVNEDGKEKPRNEEFGQKGWGMGWEGDPF